MAPGRLQVSRRPPQCALARLNAPGKRREMRPVFSPSGGADDSLVRPCKAPCHQQKANAQARTARSRHGQRGSAELNKENNPIDALIDTSEKLKASMQTKVEHPFRVVQRQFGYVRTRLGRLHGEK
jgi:hypothetical protein